MAAEPSLPSSEFLNYVLADEIAFDGSPIGRANLNLLLSLVDAPDVSDRDWATFFIAGLNEDGPAIRRALLRAVVDDHVDVRDEALVGLARRDPAVALERLPP